MLEFRFCLTTNRSLGRSSHAIYVDLSGERENSHMRAIDPTDRGSSALMSTSRRDSRLTAKNIHCPTYDMKASRKTPRTFIRSINFDLYHNKSRLWMNSCSATMNVLVSQRSMVQGPVRI